MTKHRSKNGRYYTVTHAGETYTLAGVTTILDQAAKPGLRYGAQKVIARAAVESNDILQAMDTEAAYKWLFNRPREVWGEKARRGSLAHKGVEIAIKAAAQEGTWQEPPIVDDLDTLPWVAGAICFLEEHAAKVYATEMEVANLTYRYAGTIDLVMKSKAGAAITAVDWKTGDSGVWPDSALQLTGYCHAEWHIKDDSSLGHITPALPRQGMVVHLDGEGGYEAYEARTDDRAFKTFVALRTLHEWSENHESEALQVMLRPNKEAQPA